MLRAELRSAVARLGGLHAGVPGAVRSWGNGKKGWEIAWEMIGNLMGHVGNLRNIGKVMGR